MLWDFSEISEYSYLVYKVWLLRITYKIKFGLYHLSVVSEFVSSFAKNVM